MYAVATGPCTACSCPKAIAAFADQELQSEILSSPLRAYTEQTKTHPDEIERKFAGIRHRGCAKCVEEIEIGVSSVAAPIRIGNLGVPVQRRRDGSHPPLYKPPP